MLRRCESCKRVYDDARQWTVCPHRPLEASHDGKGYCRRHDILGVTCYLCEAEKQASPSVEATCPK